MNDGSDPTEPLRLPRRPWRPAQQPRGPRPVARRYPPNPRPPIAPLPPRVSPVPPPQRPPAVWPSSKQLESPINAWLRAQSRRRLLIAAGLLAVGIEMVVLLVVLGNLGLSNDKELNVKKAQIGVQQILSDPIIGYGRNNVSSVVCNGGRNPTVAKGRSFTCAVKINGTTRHVTVAFLDDNGTYEVDRPR